MHIYVLDSKERRDVPFALAFMALGITFGGRWLLAKYTAVEPGPAAYLPSAFAVYAALYYTFDRVIWRWSVLRLMGVVSVPPIDGRWAGELRSSQSSMGKVHATDLRISQTWTSIRLTLESERSYSASEMALVRCVAPDQLEVRWEYSAESTTPADRTNYNHRGVTMLRLQLGSSAESQVMRGHYYTQQGRDTHGSISVKREDK